ncbi:helix-turn-helix domain-containing protein [Anditalea andensis]|uniref:HTH cro/C1-type domain-containing protein n=1 Tax=Anditalea andensis TaxID=1048983 RepID=A0A074KTN2_9BACT|nr:helix-turn-helix transcriptional regulator [Anditalea andensis]KEO72264.1 hypothetical protein EL17_18875 [Anditalea andensis]
MNSEKKEIILIKFGERLKELKDQSGLSYRKLAQKCDLDHADIKNFEKGKDLHLLTIIELSKAYGVKPEDLLKFDMPEDF